MPFCGCDRIIAAKKKKRKKNQIDCLVVSSALYCDFIIVPISPFDGKSQSHFVALVTAELCDAYLITCGKQCSITSVELSVDLSVA